MNLPNKLTMFRIILVPVTMALMLSNKPVIAGIVFAVASITDFFDGFIARKYNLVTSWILLRTRYWCSARFCALYRTALSTSGPW